ncbi:MAG: SHOCT domain-containing protein, partial [Lachnospiraceae bacterium]|nr:SHOCT domain-containing protein [Lachnospiraceae bacterium]
LMNPIDHSTFSFGIVCNSKINIALDCFDWSNASDAEDKKETAELESAIVNSESDRISLLKQYKDLLDSGVISQDEFDQKKKELLG